MAVFRTEGDLRGALADAGLQALADDIVATARPALIFLRRQLDDDPLPAGSCKMGGLPDLPAGTGWPVRPPLDDASARAQALLDARERRRHENPSDTDSDYEAILGHLPEDQREALRRGIEASRPDPAAIAARHADEDRYELAKAATFDRDFPLAFLGQLDLQRLSVEAGFDADLPQRGMLSLFEDITADQTDGSVHVFWFDVSVDRLQRRSPPAELVALSDMCAPSDRWEGQGKAEVLEPHSALTAPFHWVEAAGGHRAQIFDFFYEPTPQYHPVSDGDAMGQAAYFGDRLGGWPNPIQGDPEAAFLGAPRGSIAPGDARIRHLLSWGGEYHAGTRRMNTRFGGDGTTYLMMRREDLLDRKFESARAIYQGD